jgi:sec-independent protein translocase protein TatA
MTFFDAPWHIVLLLLAALVLFGSSRLPGAAKALGSSMNIFKKAVRGEDADGNTAASGITQATYVPPAPPAQTASTYAPPAPPAQITPAPTAESQQAQIDELQRQLRELQRQQPVTDAAQASEAQSHGQSY